MLTSNDNAELQPQTTFQGPSLAVDIAGFQIGVAEYAEGPTGCTVFYFPKGASTAVDIRGGSVGTIGNYDWNHAICLAGGSLYGLEAATGVSAELFAQRGYSKNFMDIALVSGAIIFDFGPRENAIYPDKQLGRAALRAAIHSTQPTNFPIGRRGAGISASVGKGFSFGRGEPAGQGGAFRQLGITKIAAFSVVNAMGAIVNREGKTARGLLDPTTGTRHQVSEGIERAFDSGGTPTPSQGNTTLTVVVTNQKLSSRSLQQFARQAHSSMARAIQPFHTIYDGDVLYAVSTNEVENPQLDEIALGVMASEVLWDAVLSIISTP